MTRTDPLRLNSDQPHTQPQLFAPRIESQLQRETDAEQEKRTKEAGKDRETAPLFGKPTIGLIGGYNLTATRRAVVVQMLEKGLTDAQAGRMTYRLRKREGSEYAVTIEYTEFSATMNRKMDRLDRYVIAVTFK